MTYNKAGFTDLFPPIFIQAGASSRFEIKGIYSRNLNNYFLQIYRQKKIGNDWIYPKGKNRQLIQINSQFWGDFFDKNNGAIPQALRQSIAEIEKRQREHTAREGNG